MIDDSSTGRYTSQNVIAGRSGFVIRSITANSIMQN